MSCVMLNAAGIAVVILLLEVSEPTNFLNFHGPFYSRIWVESALKNFDGEVNIKL